MRALILVAAGVLLATSPHALAKAQTLDIEAGTNPDGSMYLKPNAVSVALNDEVTLRVKNVDAIFHDVAILSYAGEDIEIEVPAKRTSERTFLASIAGDFRMICEVTGHKQKGMQGTLHVGEKKSPDLALPGAIGALVIAGVLLARRR